MTLSIYIFIIFYLLIVLSLSLSVSIYLFLSSLFVSYLPRSFYRCLSCSSLCQPSLLQIYKGDPRTCAIFIPTWAQIRGLRFFSRNQNNHGSSCAFVTWIYCSPCVKMNTRKMPHGAERSWMQLLCICFCVWSAKTQIRPIWAPWLTAPLLEAEVVYKVWDLLRISVISPLVSLSLLLLSLTHIHNSWLIFLSQVLNVSFHVSFISEDAKPF